MEQEVFQQRLEEDRKLVEEALHQVCQGCCLLYTSDAADD